MTDNELKEIKGGSISATLINSIARGINAFYDLGKAFGSAIRYAISGKKC